MNKLKSLISLTLLLLSLYLTGEVEGQETSKNLSGGVLVDVARRYYSLDALKSIVDTISVNNGDFIHLHLTDDQNYGLESYLLNQSVSNAVYDTVDGSYTNPNTNKKFLSYGQLEELQSYALSKGVTLIPEIDTPAHTGGLKALLPHADPSIAAQFKWAFWEEERQLDIENPLTQDIILQLYQELVQELQGLSYVHAGGDEISGGLEHGRAYVNHVNRLTQYLADQGIKTRIWNDSISRQLIPDLNRNVEITYWGYHPNKNKDMATASELSDEGFNLLNYNGYYLAFVPKASDQFISDVAYATNDIQHTWSLAEFHMNTGEQINSLSRVIGAAFSIWSEESEGLSDQEVVSAMNSPIIALLQEVNKLERTPLVTTSTTELTTETSSAVTSISTTEAVSESTTELTTEATTSQLMSESTTGSANETIAVPSTTEAASTSSTMNSGWSTQSDAETTVIDLSSMAPTTEVTDSLSTLPTIEQPTLPSIRQSSLSSSLEITTITEPSAVMNDEEQSSKTKAVLPNTGETIRVLSVAGLALFVFAGFVCYRHKNN